MIPILPEGYGKAVEAAAETAKEFLGKLLGPTAEEAGLLFGDSVRFLRFKRQVKILNEAKKILFDQSIEPERVPLKILAPILEAGSLEEDDSMASRWSSLLASAADPKRKANVLPSFPEILKQLSPLEARILDLIFEMINQNSIPRNEWLSRGAKGPSVQSFLSLSAQDFEVAIDNLYRLRLCAPPSTFLDFVDNKEHRFQLSTKELICITELGYSFVSACRTSKPQNTEGSITEATTNPLSVSKIIASATFNAP